ncbi:major capsid protein [Dipodfec virus UOA04_Rod_1109]|nr:major capsid protein [Dipodfec virus UOA04_Rod_1109]
MANQFNSIFIRKPRRNKFNLSFQNKLTAQFGYLVPFLVQDVLPGDHFKVGASHVIRLQPTVAPVMQNVDIYKHYFFVPMRLIWKQWEEFITGGVSGSSTVRPPYITLTAGDDIKYLKAGSLADYLGFPSPETTSGFDVIGRTSVNALPFLAYQLIWQEYYRDQNLMGELATEFPFDSSSTFDVPTFKGNLMTIRRRSWRKDEFTSALPWPQRSPNSVSLPVNVNTDTSISYNAGGSTKVVGSRPSSSTSSQQLNLTTGGGMNAVQDLHISDSNGTYIGSANIDNSSALRATSVSKASMANIVELRRAFKVQEWLEAMARGGSRYVEQIRTIFGIKSSDGRMQRPIYLGGSSTPLVMEQTAQTSQTSGDSVQGNLAGNGASVTKDFIFSNRFEEHGFIIGIMSVLPRAAYFQGMPAKYLKFDRYDYYWPQFAHIGEQPITKQRLYHDYTNANHNGDIFGYQPRYAEYRFNNDEVHGEFRTSLRQWHMARKFDEAPNLNATFVTVQPDVVDNVMAVDSFLAAPLLCLINNNIVASRLVSKYGTSHL